MVDGVPGREDQVRMGRKGTEEIDGIWVETYKIVADLRSNMEI